MFLAVHLFRRLQDRSILFPVFTVPAAVKAASMAGVTGNISFLFDLVDNGITVTVEQNLKNFLTIAALFAFTPKLLARARKISTESGPERLFQGFFICPQASESYRQGVLCYHGNQTV